MQNSFDNLHGPKEFINPATGEPESFSERTARIVRERQLAEQEREKREAEEKAKIPRIAILASQVRRTQKEQRELDGLKKQAKLEQAKVTLKDILDKCNKDGGCKVSKEVLKEAFPQMVLEIDGNVYRPLINVNPFSDFLKSEGLMFVLPDLIFLKG